MNPERPPYVLDAFALLALFRDEPAAPAVEQLIDRARRGHARLLMSVINLGEVVYRAIREYGVEAGAEALARVYEWPLEVIDVDQPLAMDAAYLKARHRISYSDCIAAALAQRTGATLVTGDADFRQLEAAIAIEWLPTANSPPRP